MSGWPLWLLMALMGVIIHAVGSICSWKSCGVWRTLKDACLDLSIDTKPIITNYYYFHSNYKHVQSYVYLKPIRLNAALLIMMVWNLLNWAVHEEAAVYQKNYGYSWLKVNQKNLSYTVHNKTKPFYTVQKNLCFSKWNETCVFVSCQALTGASL